MNEFFRAVALARSIKRPRKMCQKLNRVSACYPINGHVTRFRRERGPGFRIELYGRLLINKPKPWCVRQILQVRFINLHCCRARGNPFILAYKTYRAATRK